jgi:Branched-chain amino acid transport system / permease component
LFCFLRFSKHGWAVRTTAQDREAAMQMGLDANKVNAVVFAIASALGGLSGLLVGIFDGAAEAKLIALACSAPPKGRARWTLMGHSARGQRRLRSRHGRCAGSLPEAA